MSNELSGANNSVKNTMKVSIVTVTYNSGATLRDAIESVLSQDYDNIEYIIVDGQSTDATLAIIDEYRDRISVVVSEPDQGIYDAMNKGIERATGDIVGILNSDDYFPDNHIVSMIAGEFDGTIDAVYGDVAFISPSNPQKIIRYYSSKIFKPSRMIMGLSPAHPSFYVKRAFYEQYGKYNVSYQIASDFDLFVRFFSSPMRYRYIEKVFVKMRTGGISTRGLKSKYILNKEILRICKQNGIRTNLFIVLSRYFFKLFEIKV